MARYIDGDKLLEYYEERHKNLCKKNGETDAYCRGYEDAMYVAEHLDFAADVVPKAEYDAAIIDRNAARLGMIAEHERLKQAKADVNKILDEFIRLMIDHFGVNPYDRMNFDVRDLVELKKKYMED